jgi:glyoxylase-like metal-dependent hydrolase (beta-lactamase superfamily II)
MTESIRTLTFRWVNAYLVKTNAGFVLIDTGMAGNRATLERELHAAGCVPGDLRLIVITHGDPDHSGNAAYLRGKYAAKIAMHKAEAAAVEQGNMFLSRGRLPLLRRIMKPLMSLFRLRKRDRFTPDLFLEDGDRLTEYGLDATILHVPGHSAGSIAVLTDDGILFSGDFLENRTRPSVATLVDDAEALKAGFERVKKLGIRIVYPGHGKTFALDEIG